MLPREPPKHLPRANRARELQNCVVSSKKEIIFGKKFAYLCARYDLHY